MKRLIYIAVIVLFTAQTTFAVDQPSANNGLTLNLLMIPIGLFEVTYHIKLREKISLAIPISYYDVRAKLVTGASNGYQPSIGLAPKFHLMGKAFEGGIYVEPHIKLGYVVHFATSTYGGDAAVLLRQGIAFGWDYVTKFGLMIDLHAGIENYYMFRTAGEKKDPAAPQLLIRPTLMGALGYAW